MPVIQTILPLFIVILIGWAACRTGRLPAAFIGPANRLVYVLAIPAMIFRSIAGSSFRTHFDGRVLLLTLATLGAALLAAWGASARGRFARSAARGSFIQSSIHGNLGYIGLAVAYYVLGPDGLTSASILAGFMMITHNLMGVVVLTLLAGGGAPRLDWRLAGRIAANPVIVSSMAGIAYSLSGLPMPGMLDRVLGILAGTALPLALLLIGASLSFKAFSAHLVGALGAGALKLALMPAIGLALYRLAGLPPGLYLPGLILLAAPTATVVYVMALELKGDPEFSTAAISFSTLLSLLSYSLWVSLAV